MPATRWQKSRIRAQLERQKRKARAPLGVESPLREEQRYAREINHVTVDRINNLVKTFVYPMLDAMLTDEGLIDSDSTRVRREITAMFRPIIGSLGGEIEKVARDHVERTNAYHEVKFIEEMQSAIGVNLSSVLSNNGLDRKLRASTRKNVHLIKRIPRKYLARVRAIVQQGFKTGSDSFSVKRQLQEAFGIESRHAKLIARDQTSKLTSELNRFRQTDIGITHYVWRTVGDETVRPTHANNNRKSFAWSDPPSETGHPGHDVQCRCVADPDLAPVLGLVESEKNRRYQKRPVI